MAEDPRRRHPGHEPTSPPPRPERPRAAVEVDPRLAPAAEARAPETGAQAPQVVVAPAAMPVPPPPPWYAAWTPGAIAAAAVTVIVAVAAASKGIAEIRGSGDATRVAIAESEARILKQLELHADAERAARAEMQATHTVTVDRVNYLASWAVRVNGGAPHPTWPQTLQLFPPPAGSKTPYWLTPLPWPGSVGSTP